MQSFSVRPLAGLIAGLVATAGWATPSTASPGTSAGPLSGTVFSDFNANGALDIAISSTAAVDAGISGVPVKVFDPAGSQVGAVISGESGTWNLTPRAAGPYRVEYGPLPSGLQVTSPGIEGQNTAVQFVEAAGSPGIDLGVNRPEDYCQNNPTLVVNCYQYGRASGSRRPALVSFPADSGTIPSDPAVENYSRPTHPELVVPQEVIGATWGLAYDRSAKSLYAAAFMKRHSGFGPGGTGAIYRINPATGSTELFADLNSLFGAGAAGADAHDSASYDGDNRNIAWDAVAEASLGGMDISPVDQKLYVMNLADRRLYALPLAVTPTASTVQRVAAPTSLPGCPSTADARPWAVKYHQGKIYLGIICSAESTQNPRDLRAHIYTADPRTLAVSAAPVFSFPLSYPRARDAWRPWVATFPANDLKVSTYPQPVFSELAFDDGDLVIGLRDRSGDQFGFLANSGPGEGASSLDATGGDTLRACGSVGSSWTLESNGACGDITTAGVGSGVGPNGGEYYLDEYLRDTHLETSLGGLHQVPGFTNLAATIYDPRQESGNAFQGGILWWDRATARTTRSYRLPKPSYPDSGVGSTLQNSNGLGDLIALCNAAPIGIGNRLWRDDDNDGVQDAGEQPLAGLSVELWAGDGKVGDAVSSTDGLYRFISGTDSDPSDAVGGGLTANGSFEVRIPNIAGATQTAALKGLVLSPKGVGGSGVDSDAVADGTRAVIPVATGGAGFMNYSLDIGFAPALPQATRDTESTEQNTPITIDPLRNDIPSISGAPLKKTSLKLRDPADGTLKTRVTTPGEGTYVADPTTGKVTFTPAPDFTGVAQPVGYQITDIDGGLASSTITMTVTFVVIDNLNAQPDREDTQQNTPITVDPLRNDVPGVNPLDRTTVKLNDPADATYKTTITVPNEGTYTVNPATGKVTFTPKPELTGVTTPIQYQILDTNGTPTSSTITITMTEVLGKPIPDVRSTRQNRPVTTDPLANDLPGVLPADPTTLRLQDPIDSILKTKVTILQEGQYQVDPATGKITFTPLPAFIGAATPVKYQVMDSAENRLASTITVIVTPTTPKAAPDVITVSQNTRATIDPSANDVPGAPDTPLDRATVKLKDPIDGIYKTSVTIPNAGTHAVNRTTGRVIFTPVPRFTGTTAPIRYQIRDANGTAATSTITITVTPILGIAVPDSTSTRQGIPVTTKPLANDLPGALPLNPQSVRLKDPADGIFKTKVTIPREGSYLVTPKAAVITFRPEPLFTGNATPVAYRVADTAGRSMASAVSISVATVTPVVRPNLATTVPATPVVLPVIGNDTAGAPGVPLDPATVLVQNPNTGDFRTEVRVATEGTYRANPKTGKVTFTPTAKFTGATTPLRYRIKDVNGTVAMTWLMVTVIDPQRPVAVPDLTSTPQGRRVTIDPLFNDRRGPDGAAVVPGSVLLQDPTTGEFKGGVTLPRQGGFTIDKKTGKITFTPEQRFAATVTPLVYRVKDATGRTSTATVAILVIPNLPLALPDSGATHQGIPLNLEPLANDHPGGTALDPATIQLVDPADGAPSLMVTIAGEGSFVVNPRTGKVRFTPEPGFVGVSTAVHYQVRDRAGQLARSTLSVTVPPDFSPAAVPDASWAWQGSSVTVNPLYNDIFGRAGFAETSVALWDPATSTFGPSVNVPDEGTHRVDPITGKVTFTPKPGFFGVSAPITYRVRDGAGRWASSAITITVIGVTPIAYPSEATTQAWVPVTLPVAKNGVPGSPTTPLDPASVRLIDPATAQGAGTITVAREGTWTIAADRKGITFTPKPGFEGTTTAVPYQVLDANTTAATALARVHVTSPTPSALADPPVSQDPITVAEDRGRPAGQPVALNSAASDIPDSASGFIPKTLDVAATSATDPARISQVILLFLTSLALLVIGASFCLNRRAKATTGQSPGALPQS